ncbi:hypothetical protein [Streptomyces griseoluteus]|uniref:hypothetical protein n=1 Tax=Streptomyces griseoluteus TaxID=29306 RepID=UPI0036E164A1
MATVPKNYALQRLLRAADWGPAQLAQAIRRLAAEDGVALSCHHTTVRRWLNGTRPRPPYPGLLLECLSRRLGRRVSAHEAGLSNAPVIIAGPSWTADPLHRLAQLTRVELDPNQPPSAGNGVYTLAALSSPAIDSPLAAAPRGGSFEADGTAAMGGLFAAVADRYGGRHTIVALSAHVAHEVLPRLTLPIRPQARPALLSSAARLTLLLGNMSIDSGRDATAQQYHLIAAQLAAEAGDEAALAISLRAMVTHAYARGHHTAGVLRLAELADRHAPLAVRAYTESQLAVILAHHDRRAASVVLSRAERSQDRATKVGGVVGPFGSYPTSALYFQRAQALEVMGDSEGAVSALNTSIRLRSPAEVLPGALTRARLAEMHFKVGNIDQAVDSWEIFVQHYPEFRSAKATNAMQGAHRLLRSRRLHRRAAELDERILSLLEMPS